METIRLKCIKVGNKLRVRIISPGYFNEANCQFPRNLRIEGRIYEVPALCVTLVTRSKNYYTILKPKHTIKVIKDNENNLIENNQDFKLKVFEDNLSDDCAICMTNEKCMVIVPCGHYYTCHDCTSKINKCPICRISFVKAINKSEMQS